MKKTGLMLFGVLLVAAGGFFVGQQRVVSRLQSENQTLRRLTDELQPVREENVRLAKERIDPAELERLRAGQSELVRLRGQVAQLRRQVAEATNRLAAAAKAVSTVPAETALPPYETFTASAEAIVPWQQALVVGGWKTAPGKQTMVFIQPHPVEGGAGQVELQAKFVDMPDSAFGQMGIKSLTADGKDGEGKIGKVTGVLTSEQTALVMKALEQMPGVDVLSAPRVITADGRQAQVKVADVKTAPSGEQYELGPTLDLVPKISDDRSSVLLHVNAQLRLPAAPAR